METTDWLLDKALVWWDGMLLTATGDFQVVSWDENTLQSAQNRIKSLFETRTYDETYWWELLNLMKTTPIQKITESQISSYISHTLLPMIQDGRIKSIDSVKILSIVDTNLYVEVIVTMWTFTGTITVEVTNFIS